jgi:hypothetical protein
MKKRFLFVPFCAIAALAQPPAPPAPPAPPPPPEMMTEFIRTEASISSKSVKGVPYSAEGVNETSQILADGNKITRKSTSNVYRDSQGRTRNEHSFEMVGPWAGKGEKMVTIVDPVAKVTINLHPVKTAMRIPMPVGDGNNMTFFKTVTDGVGAGGGAVGTFERRADGPRIVHVDGSRTVGVAAIPATPGMRIENDIVIERGPAMGGVMYSAGAAAGATTQKRSFNRESLGKKVIEGVEAEGTRSVMTIEAGQIGNERPIEIVDETWYSKEIEALIYSRHSDPRTGETTYKLTNIRRGEQPLDLFEIPADYKVNEAGPGRFEFKMRTAPKPNDE